MAVFKFRNLKNGQATPIPPGEFVIGRTDDAYVHVADGSVSRRHAKITNNDAGFFVEDLGSSNGTATRGAFIKQRIELHYGDVIHIGSVPFRVDPEVAGETDAAPSAGMRAVNSAYMRRDTERLPEGRSPERIISHENSTLLKDLASQGHVDQPGSVPAAGETVSQRPAMTVEDLIQTPPSRTTPNWSWLFLSFLVGMGTGLLLGLFFAKLLLSMGGKASFLP